MTFNKIRFLLPDLHINIRHGWKVDALTHLYKIVYNTDNPFLCMFPDLMVKSRTKLHFNEVNDRAYAAKQLITSQYS